LSQNKDIWTNEKPASQRTPHATPIIPHEVQTSETQKHTNSLQQNSKREEFHIKNVNS
jgi:hypothetical protein